MSRKKQTLFKLKNLHLINNGPADDQYAWFLSGNGTTIMEFIESLTIEGRIYDKGQRHSPLSGCVNYEFYPDEDTADIPHHREVIKLARTAAETHIREILRSLK